MQSLYNKAARAELDRSYNEALRLYVEAAQAYLQLARNLPNERDRLRCQAEVKKCVDRADRIKSATKGQLKPLVRDPFSLGMSFLSSVLIRFR